MAETVVHFVAKRLDESRGKYAASRTKHLPISGGYVGGSKNFQQYISSIIPDGIEVGLSHEQAEATVKMYGSNAPVLFKLIKEKGAISQEYHLPILLWAKLHYALDFELAMTPNDVLLRRTGLLLFDINTVKQYKNNVINYMEDYFLWTKEEKIKFINQLEMEMINATIPSDLQNDEYLDEKI
jgi:glycerol-3-phosphate dehydrogenase